MALGIPEIALRTKRKALAGSHCILGRIPEDLFPTSFMSRRLPTNPGESPLKQIPGECAKEAISGILLSPCTHRTKGCGEPDLRLRDLVNAAQLDANCFELRHPREGREGEYSRAVLTLSGAVLASQEVDAIFHVTKVQLKTP